MGTRGVGLAVLLGGCIAALFAACAQGNQLTGAGGGDSGGAAPSTTTSGTSSTGGGMPEGGPAGSIGSPCESQSDCDVGTCTKIGDVKYCSQPCPPACPMGSYCSIIGGVGLCVPDLDQQCQQCSVDTDCKLPSDQCFKAPPGDKFCARDCSVDGVCPNGFTCVSGATYEGGADGGAPDGGGADAGPSTMPTKWCVPNGGVSCPCNAKRDGVTHACAVTNASGTCNGTETCDGKDAKWKGCTAATPAAETCNGKDDNCNGMADDGDPNLLCASMGPKPPHASWACGSGTCKLGACDPGYTSYPPGSAAEGCPCAVDAAEPNGTCGAATQLGPITDTGAPITLTGTLSSASDVDVYAINVTDTPEGATNSFHMSIAFTAPATNNEFVMDVMRGGCNDAPTGPSTNIVAYDWCVNGSDGASPPTGEGSCGNVVGQNHCSDNSGIYYVRVYRKQGAAASCSKYTINVSAGGGNCDFTKKCP